jgi:hypothetical protein
VDQFEDILAEFRALGGTAENICLKEGPYGRGLFPQDPSKPVKIHIPDSLLVDHKFAEFHEGKFRLAADAPMGPRERAFLERYENDLSWPSGKREIETVFQIMQEGSPDLRELLRKSYYAHRWVSDPTDETIQQRFLDARVIHYKGRDVIMPFVELANHGQAAQYQRDDGVGLSGAFAGEILARYQAADPLQIFGKWGFASNGEQFALSIHIRNDGAGLVVERQDPNPETATPPFMPTVARDPMGRLTLSYMLLGHRQRPGLPRGIFYRIMRDAGRQRNEADQAFDSILHLNRMHMLKLIATCENEPPRVGHLLRNVARFQLEAMSYCIGHEEI